MNEYLLILRISPLTEVFLPFWVEKGGTWTPKNGKDKKIEQFEKTK